jgi:hypothetical protein
MATALVSADAVKQRLGVGHAAHPNRLRRWIAAVLLVAAAAVAARW